MPTSAGNPTEAETLKAQEASNPIDLHAQMFKYYLPLFKNGLGQLNKKALIRVIGSLIEVTLNDVDIKLRSKVEKDVFQMGDQLLTSKYIMMIYTDAQQQQMLAEKNKIPDGSIAVSPDMIKDEPSIIEGEQNNG